MAVCTAHVTTQIDLRRALWENEAGKSSLRRLLAMDCTPNAEKCDMDKECVEAGHGCMLIMEGDGHCQSHSQCYEDLLCGYENCQEFDPDLPSNRNCCFDPKKEGHTVIVGSDSQYYSQHCMGPAVGEPRSYKLYSQKDCTDQREKSDKQYTAYMDTLNHFAHIKGNVAGVAFIGDVVENGKNKWIRKFDKKMVWGKHFYPSLGNHDVWDPVERYERTEPQWASNMYWWQAKKMYNIRNELHSVDDDSLAYSYVLGNTLYVNLQFGPAFVGLSFLGEDDRGFERQIELKSPTDWFKDLLQHLPADTIFPHLRSIVLIYHVPGNARGERYVDVDKWADIVMAMQDWQKAHPETPILASLTGHIHHWNGYFRYDDLEDDMHNRPIRRFVAGSRDYMAFLSLKMFDHHDKFEDRYYEVWSHAQDPKTKEWTSLCINKLGKTDARRMNGKPKCTQWYFNNAYKHVEQPASYV